MANQDYDIRQANPPYQPEPNETIIDNWANINTPYHQQSEEGVCGSVLIGGRQTYDKTAAVMEANDLFILRLRYVWESFKRLADQGRDIDYLTVWADLKEAGKISEIGGPAYLSQLSSMQGTHLNAVSYAYTVRMFALRRRGMALADDIKSLCADTRKGVQASMAELSTKFHQWLAELPNLSTASAEEISEEIRQDLNNPLEVLPAIKSGLKGYDELIGGFTPGNVYVFGADAGVGKSSLVQNFVLNNPDKRIAYFSTEMNRKAILSRLLKIKTGISQRMIREQILSPAQKQLVGTTLDNLASRPIYVDHSPGESLTPEKLKSRAMQIKGAHGMDLLIVDHATDMAPPVGFEKVQDQEKQGAIARELTLLAAALNVPILVVVQLNREVHNVKDSRPRKWHIRGSGRWEQLAAVITLLYREEHYNEACEFPNTAELIVDKVRDDGETGTVRVFTDKERNLFANAVYHSIDLSKIDDIPPVPKHNVDF